MNDTINSRTPDEIKKGLECAEKKMCYMKGCPYYKTDNGDGSCIEENRIDALAYIQRLENHIGELTEMVRRLERERDAAVEDLKLTKCETCKYYTPGYFCIGCRRGDQWEWRGV